MGEAPVMRQVVLKAHPHGAPRPSDFAVVEAPIPTPGDGEILVRSSWLALDPLIRFALDNPVITGVAKVAIGEVVYGGAVSRVIQSNHPDYAPGDWVESRTGWRDYAVIDPGKLPARKIDGSLASPSAALSVLGMPGQTANVGMRMIGRVTAGETVVISAAAGTVGTIAGQIGTMLGARVVGIAGGPEKCARLLDIGFDAAVDYRAPDYADQLKAAVPDGIDVYFENVGGAVMEPVMPLLKRSARMPLCGFVAYYGVGREGPGPDHLPGFLRTIMTKGLEVKGFGGALQGGQQALDEVTQWVREGHLKPIETVIDGIENVPAAFCAVFGKNDYVGKALVRVGPTGDE